MKLKPATLEGEVWGYSFFCPGCDSGHVFRVTGDMVWSFNGNMTAPSFSPSLLNTCERHPDPKQRRCHLQLLSGKIHYAADCTHDLAGQVVELPDRWPE